jgi:hypothetical protein
MANYLNFSVQTEGDMMDWICMQLGYPLVQVEITEPQLQMCINDSVEEFTKYVNQEEQYLGLNLSGYTPTEYDGDGKMLSAGGFILSDWTFGRPMITGVFDLENSGNGSFGGHNTLFTISNTMWGQGMLPIPGATGGGVGGGGTGAWVNYEMARSYIDLTKRMTASQIQYEFNPREQRLTLIPEPRDGSGCSSKGFICIGVRTIRPDDQQYGESWCKRFALACAKIVIGNVRSKYEGTQLLGGGAINTTIKDEGLSEKVELLDELRSTYTYVDFFMG